MIEYPFKKLNLKEDFEEMELCLDYLKSLSCFGPSWDNAYMITLECRSQLIDEGKDYFNADVMRSAFLDNLAISMELDHEIAEVEIKGAGRERLI